MGKAVPALTHRGFVSAALQSLRRNLKARSLRAGRGFRHDPRSTWLSLQSTKLASQQPRR